MKTIYGVTELIELDHFYLEYKESQKNSFIFSLFSKIGDKPKLINTFSVNGKLIKVDAEENSFFTIYTNDQNYYIDLDGKVFNSLDEVINVAINKGNTQKNEINGVDVYKVKYSETSKFIISSILNGFEFCDINKVEERTKELSFKYTDVEDNKYSLFENAEGTKIICYPTTSKDFFEDKIVFGHSVEELGYFAKILNGSKEFNGFIEVSDYNKIEDGQVKFIFNVDINGEPVYKYFNLKENKFSKLTFSYRFTKEYKRRPQEGLYAATCEVQDKEGNYEPFGIYLDENLNIYRFKNNQFMGDYIVTSFKNGTAVCSDKEVTVIKVINRDGEVIMELHRSSCDEEKIDPSDFKDCLERLSDEERKRIIEDLTKEKSNEYSTLNLEK